MTVEEIEALEYVHPKLLASGEWAALRQMFFTVGLFVGLDQTGYRTRFCYPNMAHAVLALDLWDGTGDPPGPWIKQKGLPGGDRSNPRAQEFRGIPVIEEYATISEAAWIALTPRVIANEQIVEWSGDDDADGEEYA
jgi:hypothetical protein